MRRDHSQLAPVVHDFIPRGRTVQDVALYKVMRWQARRNRQEVYDAARQATLDMMRFGQAYYSYSWD